MSVYTIKIIFNIIDNQTKLKLIRYNKNLQNKININILHYRAFSNRYIKYEANNKVKEYNSTNDKIKYFGDYLNGNRNGKGEEYDVDKQSLIFKGEYLKGKRNGKGKEYDNNGKLKFEGEYLLGKKWNGKIYDIKDKNLIDELKKGKGYVKELRI